MLRSFKTQDSITNEALIEKIKCELCTNAGTKKCSVCRKSSTAPRNVRKPIGLSIKQGVLKKKYDAKNPIPPQKNIKRSKSLMQIFCRHNRFWQMLKGRPLKLLFRSYPNLIICEQIIVTPLPLQFLTIVCIAPAISQKSPVQRSILTPLNS